MKRIFCVVLCVFMLLYSLPVSAVSVSASAATLIDGVSGKVFFSKNQNARLSMASTTKIMTALLLCESGKLADVITITPEMVYIEGSSMGLRVGMRVTGRDLLYGMMLSSGNDAATAAAIAVGGSVKSFVSMMNERAIRLGLENTHFDTPSGLDGDTHYTTSYDLACLARFALSNSDFYNACKTKRITLDCFGEKITLNNHNKLLNMYEGAVGVKTGFTKKSGRCLVSAAEKNGGLVIAVTLNDGNDWNDHINMLEYGFSLMDEELISFEESGYSIPVFSGESDFVTAKSEGVQFRTVSGEAVIKKEYIYPYLYAPVKRGDEVGYIEYTNGGFTVAVQRLYAQEDVNEVKQTDSLLKIFTAFVKMLCYI